MAKGVVSGAIWGTVICVGGLGTLSVLDTSESDRLALAGDVANAVTEPEPVGAVATDQTGPAAADTKEQAQPEVVAQMAPDPVDGTPTEEGAQVAPPAKEVVAEEGAENATPQAEVEVVPDAVADVALADTTAPETPLASGSEAVADAETSEEQSAVSEAPTADGPADIAQAPVALATDPAQDSANVDEAQGAGETGEVEAEQTAAVLSDTAPNARLDAASQPDIPTEQVASIVGQTASVAALTVPETPSVLATPDTSVDQAPDASETLAPPQVAAAPDAPDVSPGESQTAPEIDEASAALRSSASDATVPSLDDPVAGSDPAPEIAAADPIPVPQTGGEVAALALPETEGSVGLVTPAALDPIRVPPTPTADLRAPDREAALEVSTEPAAPLPPKPAEPQDAGVETADASRPEDQPQVVETAQQVPQQDTPAVRDRPQVRKLIPDTPATGQAEGADDTVTSSRPSIGRPASSLIDRQSGVASRLPSVVAGEAAQPASPSASTPAADAARPPLERFAAEYQVGDAALPLMSIVLLDDGAGPLGPDTIDNFPFPVTFALDPGQPGVADRMSAYRALGYEVATVAHLPEGAQPTDIEQMLAGAIAAVPEAVALVEAPASTGLQSNRSSAEQATAFAADSGHGVVFLPNGLNTAEAIARRAKVPAVSVLRDFDGAGQDGRTKRRFLDGAAFRARQDGSAVMLGRLTPDTVSALLLWSLQDRASRVSMVPVSAILSRPAE